ncbi:MAG: hypothetical protein ACYS47_05755 [Planctomycetota bacterium]
MVIVEVGIPPGCDPIRTDLDEQVLQRGVDRYTLQPRRVTMYFGRLRKGDPVWVGFGLRARKRLNASIPPSVAYEYYDPDNRCETPARRIEVK